MKNIKQIKEEIKANGLTGRAFQVELQNRLLIFGKSLAEDILCGFSVTNFTWQDAAFCLAHLSEIFVESGHPDFDSDFAENFQTEIFNLSPQHLDSYLQWRVDIFGDTPTEAEAGQIIEETETAEADRIQRQKQHLDELAQNLEAALTSDETSDGVKECLKTIIYEASSEANLPLGDLRLVRAAFPNIIEALPFDYGTGVYHAINSILQYNTNVYERKTENVLDLSESNAEDLGQKLSEILQNPNLPVNIYNSIKGGLDDVYNELPSPGINELSDLQDAVQDSPEYLAKLIKFSEVQNND